jgi:hypothetical protein
MGVANERRHIFVPVSTLEAPAPEDLLKLIFCNCRHGFERACGCVKAGFRCTSICGHCRGIGCLNSSPIEDVSNDPNVDELENNSDIMAVHNFDNF